MEGILMRFEVCFTTDNAAFKDYRDFALLGPERREIARILNHIKQQVEQGGLSGHIYDANGNKVGRYELIFD
jgi:hypothetical protein